MTQGAVPQGLVERKSVRLPVAALTATYCSRLIRAVACRFDKLAVRFEATVLTAAINEWP
ncbi:hypothetical protein GCM10010254_70980 [Streptomyces chromofuscus]|nr:hypothetical protein GCM10010254_70980 [Streptomyces chromofuscus]